MLIKKPSQNTRKDDILTYIKTLKIDVPPEKQTKKDLLNIPVLIYRCNIVLTEWPKVKAIQL